MPRGHMKYRHLSRSSSHRQALLRNLVTSLFKHETIATTWHKAKEAQVLAEKLVTLGKKNTEATRRRAMQIFYEPNDLVPKLFGSIRERYANRPGGYTRILRIEPMKEDQAESAILELVDGPKDMRFAMTAKSLARRDPSQAFSPAVTTHVKKATQFRKNGVEDLRTMVETLRRAHQNGLDDRILPKPRSVYPEDAMKRGMHYFEEVDDHKKPNPDRIKWFKKVGKKVHKSLHGRKKPVSVQEPASNKENIKQIV
ncbi:RplQ Ribosomal protein L17 [Pyrenophora tritici-repentis]|uniref:Large ribosomal subunit protein bL17m n=2 Tax=Pyrenophora tritici-repentis TaxID=45151 RepID=A0A2W1HGY4_9PLEO|nr:mitochondrial 54S ribosomal protein YmL8 [Pyrenophora tritici-repentis Pt-1C-BFP]KAA8619799.1 50S ribosomal protein L17 [Pyrenophora tritici-repentis]EDU46951.1 50S ribosomal protein L17 [Pyrenophora tritici-repentis Pt-1C-BFP]KAF7447940.1 50S ribosomal protein [Pyrenophora tritici-repentis]KAF7571646.1 RplQ, Ribosomal protein L17 [Pyrenophora tritici-repentis]KAG9385135.1 50S ribosomal protein L17 [Pyrenophora tritici-repentis]